jgi:hypothetical protein
VKKTTSNKLCNPFRVEMAIVFSKLSTFKGIHDEQPLFPGALSIAERIVQKYAEMSLGLNS